LIATVAAVAAGLLVVVMIYLHQSGRLQAPLARFARATR
jgi:hypothetical protein